MTDVVEKVKKPRTEKQIEAITKLNLARKKAKEMMDAASNDTPKKVVVHDGEESRVRAFNMRSQGRFGDDTETETEIEEVKSEEVEKVKETEPIEKPKRVRPPPKPVEISRPPSPPPVRAPPPPPPLVRESHYTFRKHNYILFDED